MVDRWSMYTDGEPSLKTKGYLKFADDWEHWTDAHSVFLTSLDRTLRSFRAARSTSSRILRCSRSR